MLLFVLILLFVLFNEAVDIRKFATELIGFSREFNELVELSTEVILNKLFDNGTLLFKIIFFNLCDLLLSVEFSGFIIILFIFLLNKSIFGFNSEKYLLLSIFLGSILHNLLNEHHIKGSISKLFLYA